MRNKLLFLLLLLIVLSSSVNALGISPPRNIIGFKPGMEGSSSFRVLNSRPSPLPIEIKISGDEEITPYIELDQTEYVVPANGVTVVNYRYDLPEELSPGRRTTKITAEEKTPKSEGMVIAKVAVSHQFWVDVPYPGKYISAKLNIGKLSAGQDTIISIDLSNMGLQDVENAYAVIEIQNETGQVVDTMTTNSVSVESKGKARIYSDWTADVEPGNYICHAKIYYDGQETSTKKDFLVGDIYVKIVNIETPEVSPDSIAKINVLLQSNWNTQIDDIYVDMEVYDNNKEIIGKATSETFFLGAWREKTVTLFWDVGELEEGTYNIKITVNYAEKTTERSAKIIIASFMIDYIYVVIILAIVLFAGLLYYEKKDSLF